MFKPEIKQNKINSFYGGISDDVRQADNAKFVVASHFDMFSNPYRLSPYRSLEADTNDGSTATGMKQYFVRDFLYASSSAKMYGLGQNGAGKVKIVYKADAATGNWTLPANSEGNGAVWNGCFVEYKDYLWGFQGTNQIFKWGLLSGTPSITNSVATVASTITSVADGVIASDANLYLAYNNVVVRIQPGLTVTDNAKTVPSNYKITSLANYGNYLAIGCSPVANYNGVSKVFLWDLSSDLFAETIDWGEGELRILETVEGYLVGVTDRYLNNDTGAGKGSMIIQMYSGGKIPTVMKEIFTKKLTGKSIPQSKAVRNNRLFWAAKIMTNDAGTEYVEGLWSFGRKNANYPWAVNLDITDSNINTSGIQGFDIAGNFFFIAHSNDGSIDKTNDSAVYTQTSIYESQLFDFDDIHVEKQLNHISVSVVPMPAGGSLVVKIKHDDETSWRTIGTFNTENEVSHDFICVEPTDAPFPSFNEIQVRFESTGGVEVTSYEIRANFMNEPFGV